MIPTYSLPDLCDAFTDEVSVAEPLFTDFGGRERFAGSIATVKCFEDNSLVADAVADEGMDRVLVVDAGGSRRCGVFGDNLATRAAANGWAGVLIYGCIRDAEIIAGIDLGVRAVGVHPMRSVKRNEGLRDVPLAFAGIRFVPGHYLYADRNGILTAPRQLSLP